MVDNIVGWQPQGSLERIAFKTDDWLRKEDINELAKKIGQAHH